MECLPNEIMIKILSYLPTIDLIQFSRAYEDYSHFLKERHVIQQVNFKRMFDMSEFDFCSFITTHLGYNYVKVLNIEGLYWISLHDLRKLLAKLDNLEELYAVDTLLGLRTKDICLYGRLTKLSISVAANQFENVSSDEYFNVFYRLKLLLMKFIHKQDMFDDLYFFLGTLTQLNELWINDDDQKFGLNYNRIVATLPNLNKLVIKSKRPMPLLDFSCWGLLKVFQNKRYEFEVENIFERVSLLEYGEHQIVNPNEPVEKSWEALKNLHYDMPCGPSESELIHLKNDIKNIYFKDLNFCHAIILCNSKYNDAALKILTSKNASRLKRLALRTCLFLDDIQPSRQDQASVSMTVGVDITCIQSFRKIANNLKNLTELEILNCSRCNSAAVLSAYPIIALFSKLEKLTLEFPHLLDGIFLKEVFIKCDRLKSLRLICMSQNEKFIINLCYSLKYAQSLRDLRLEYNIIDVDKLFDGLNAIEEKKLSRLFLKCASLKTTTEKYGSLQNFMDKNPQLIFFFMVAFKNTMRQRSTIQKIFNSFKEGNPAKIFYVKKDVHSFSGDFPIPTAHHDMIFNRTCVSVINFDEF